MNSNMVFVYIKPNFIINFRLISKLNFKMSTSNNSTANSTANTEASNTPSTATTASNKKSENVTNVPKDKHSVSKRLQQELLSLMMSGEKGVSAFPDGDNLFKWIGTIQGPTGTVKFFSQIFNQLKKLKFCFLRFTKV